jgi:hypothetical protein
MGMMREATKEESDSVNAYIKSISSPTGVNILDSVYNMGTISVTTPRVFIFKTHEKNFMKVQEYFKKCIDEGCLVIPDDIEFVGIEDSYKERKIEY